MPTFELELKDEGWITVHMPSSSRFRLLLIILAVTAPLCVATWYISKRHYEGIRDQQVLEQLQREAEKPYPLWMYLTLTSMLIFAIQFTLYLRELMMPQVSSLAGTGNQRRARSSDPRTVESIRHPNERDINSMLWFRR